MRRPPEAWQMQAEKKKQRKLLNKCDQDDELEDNIGHMAWLAVASNTTRSLLQFLYAAYKVRRYTTGSKSISKRLTQRHGATGNGLLPNACPTE
jgi:hypothetical protein